MEFDLVIVTARPQICALPEKFLCTFITPLAMFQETLSWTKNVGIAKGSRQKNGYCIFSGIFFGMFLTLDYDHMCSEKDFTQEKGHFHPTSRIPNLSMYTVYCLLLLSCHKMVR